MSERINHGRIRPNHTGPYSSTADYVPMDITDYEGSSYWCIKPCRGVPPTDTTCWKLSASKGTDGRDGTDGTNAYQPFKGWHADASSLSTAFPSPQVGDYAFVKGATSSDPATIYECTTAGTWTASQREFNPANNQDFASGQSLNMTRIVNNLTTGGVDNVLSAEQGKIINEDLTELGNELEAVDDIVNGTTKNYNNGSWNSNGANGGKSGWIRSFTYIPVSPGDTIVWNPGEAISGCCLITYDAEKTKIASRGAGSTSITLTMPENAAFVRHCFNAEMLNEVTITRNGRNAWSPKENTTGLSQRMEDVETGISDAVEDITENAEEISTLNNKLTPTKNKTEVTIDIDGSKAAGLGFFDSSLLENIPTKDEIGDALNLPIRESQVCREVHFPSWPNVFYTYNPRFEQVTITSTGKFINLI